MVDRRQQRRVPPNRSFVLDLQLEGELGGEILGPFRRGELGTDSRNFRIDRHDRQRGRIDARQNIGVECRHGIIVRDSRWDAGDRHTPAITPTLPGDQDADGDGLCPDLGAAPDEQLLEEPSVIVFGGSASRQSPYQQLAACAHHGQAAEQPDLGAELGVPRRHQQRANTPSRRRTRPERRGRSAPSWDR